MLTDSKKECQRMIKSFIDALNNSTWIKCRKCDDEYKPIALNEFGICIKCHEVEMNKNKKPIPTERTPEEIIDNLEVSADE